ncbi:MAG: DUF4271 domain-containing protein [Flavobacteriales bacterium]
MNAIPKIQAHGDWLIGVLIFITILFASTIYSYRKLMWKTILSGFFKQYYISLQREENEIYKKVSARLNFIALLVLSLFLYLWLNKTQLNAPLWYQKMNGYIFKGFSLYIFLFALLTFLVFLQIAIIRSLAFIFNTQTEAKEHEFNLWLIYKLLGVYSLPVVFFIAYSNNAIATLLLYFSIILFGAVLLRRYFIGFWLGLSMNSFPKIYSILYICTLEILPLAILVKLYKTEIQTILSF